MKYIHKYFTKGPDRCLVQTNNGDLVKDELNTYLDSRYIGATEACWRIFKFDLRFRSPSVEKLMIHLEGQQNALFSAANLTKQQLEEIAEKNKTSQLMKFFEHNAKQKPDEKLYTYDQILRHWRWEKTSKSFIKRKQDVTKMALDYEDQEHAKSNQIGRIPIITLNPHTRELFFLRLLLHHVVGPKSFEDIRTVDGKVYETYQT